MYNNKKVIQIAERPTDKSREWVRAHYKAPSPRNRIYESGPWWVREQRRRERAAIIGSLILIFAVAAGIAYIAGTHDGTRTANTLLQVGTNDR